MTLTVKEGEILKDLKAQEQLCIKKYDKYSSAACDPALKALFVELKTNEQAHLETINRIIAGEEVKMPAAPKPAAASKYDGAPSSCSVVDRENDAYLVNDALSMEKHVSGVYNTGVFEFCSPTPVTE